MTALLELTGVCRTFARGGGVTRAVDRVDLTVGAGETVGLIGESGSGKSTLGRLALLLLHPDAGQVRFGGEDLTALTPRELRTRRASMQVVFQEPAESLDPQRTVADSVAEPLEAMVPRIDRAERDRRVAEAFEHVGLDTSLTDRFPMQLSGGQQQRVGIARAIVTRPSLVVLDEPTSSLDLSVRAGVIALLQRLQAEMGMAYLFISHDLGTVEYMADRIVVLYRGRVVETGVTAEVVAAPRHPYTRALIAARLDVDPRVAPEELPVRVSGLGVPESGCAYRNRCPLAQDDCADTIVELAPAGPQREVACLHPAGSTSLPA